MSLINEIGYENYIYLIYTTSLYINLVQFLFADCSRNNKSEYFKRFITFYFLYRKSFDT
jgi:hypothetical protein